MSEAIVQKAIAPQNFFPAKQAGVRRVFPEINGVLITYHADYCGATGRAVLKPYVSTLCVDKAYSEKLAQAARQLLKDVPVILLEGVADDE